MIENPDLEIIKRWGPLAYVDERERQSILNLPFGMFKPRVKQLETAIKNMKKRKQESGYKELKRHPK